MSSKNEIKCKDLLKWNVSASLPSKKKLNFGIYHTADYVTFDNFFYLCLRKFYSLTYTSIMKIVPLKSRTEEVEKVISLSTRSDKSGNILHCVEYPDENSPSGMSYAMFSHLSSAFDFVYNNLMLDENG